MNTPTLREKEDELQHELDSALVELDKTKVRIAGLRASLKKLAKGIEAESKILKELEGEKNEGDGGMA